MTHRQTALFFAVAASLVLHALAAWGVSRALPTAVPKPTVATFSAPVMQIVPPSPVKSKAAAPPTAFVPSFDAQAKPVVQNKANHRQAGSRFDNSNDAKSTDHLNDLTDNYLENINNNAQNPNPDLDIKTLHPEPSEATDDQQVNHTDDDKSGDAPSDAHDDSQPMSTAEAKAAIEARIMAAWKNEPTPPNQAISFIAHLDDQGNVISLEFIAGHQSLQNAAKNAIDAAAPFSELIGIQNHFKMQLVTETQMNF